MRRLIALASAAAITLAALPPAAFAQGRNPDVCTPGQQDCTRKDGQKDARQPDQKQGQKQGAQKHARNDAGKKQPGKGHKATSPKKGDTARGGQPFQRASNSRFGPPPKGQEYRVIDEHLVLADSQTMRVVAVVGLLSSLLN